MGGWLRKVLLQDGAGNAPCLLRTFTTTDATLSQDSVKVEGEAWLVDVGEGQVVRLFEIASPEAEGCRIVYRATMKSDNLRGRAYLEMWCRLPGRGEFFSKGLNQVLKGTTDWASYEIPFRLKKGQRPDLIKLNLAVEGQGRVWIKDIELLKSPR
jgi:hypothetical protein